MKHDADSRFFEGHYLAGSKVIEDTRTGQRWYRASNGSTTMVMVLERPVSHWNYQGKHRAEDEPTCGQPVWHHDLFYCGKGCPWWPAFDEDEGDDE